MLFNLREDPEETEDLSDQHPGVVAELKKELEQWNSGLQPDGWLSAPLNVQEREWYRYYF